MYASRFSLLTGSYAFRRNAAILPGTAPLIIDSKKGTLASMLKRAGYKTAAIGKWHLGLGRGNIDWNKKIAPGPLEVGFDYSFIIPATPDRVPTVFVQKSNELYRALKEWRGWLGAPVPTEKNPDYQKQ